MIIAFSGPDNVGKGTQIELTKRFLEEKGHLFHVLKYGSIKGPNILERSQKYYKEMFDIIKFATFNGKNLILDRLHDGEVVYGPIYREYSGEYIYDIEESFGARVLNNIKLFVFIDEPENLLKREDGLSFTTDISKKQSEINKFEKFYDNTRIKHKTLINIAGKTVEQVFDEVKHHLIQNNFC